MTLRHNRFTVSRNSLDRILSRIEAVVRRLNYNSDRDEVLSQLRVDIRRLQRYFPSRSQYVELLSGIRSLASCFRSAQQVPEQWTTSCWYEPPNHACDVLALGCNSLTVGHAWYMVCVASVLIICRKARKT